MYPGHPRAEGFPKGRAFPSLTAARDCQPSPAGGRRSALAQTAPPKRFFSSTGRGAFSFWRNQKENGGRIPPDKPPAGAEIPEAAATAAHLMLPPLVASPHQIVDGDAEVVRQFPDVFQIRQIGPSFKPLIM